MELEKPSVVDHHELMWKARRYLWPALLPIVVMACAAVLYVKLTVPIYESSVVISLGDRTQMSQAIEPLVRSDRDRESVNEKVAGVTTRVMNRGFMERISNRVGLTRTPEVQAAAGTAVRKFPRFTREQHAARLAVEMLSRKVSVTPGGLANVRISATDASPDEALKLASAIGEELIEDTRRGTLERVHARGEFSEDQIAVYGEKVRRSEGELRAYQESLIGRKVSVGLVDANNLEQVRQLVDGASQEMDQVRGRIASDRRTWAALVGAGVPIPDLRGPGIADGESQLVSMEASYGVAAIQRSAAAAGGGDTQGRLNEIGVTRQELLSAYERAAQGLPGTLDASARQLAAGMALDRAVLRSIQARQDRLNALLNSYLTSERSMPREQMELERLRNEVQTNRDLLTALQREATSSRLSEALETSQLSLRVEIVEPPVLPIFPIWPDRMKILAGALLIGAVLAAGLIVAGERMGAIIRTVDQIEEELGAKVIGTMPKIEGWSRPGSFLANHWAPFSIVTVLILTALVTGIFSNLKDKQAAPTATELRH